MKKNLHVLNDFIESCTAAFRDSGGRVTETRLSVVRCLAQSAVPLTAKEIFEMIDKKMKIDQVSVYRILEALSDLDLVHQVFPGGGYIPCHHTSCEETYHILTCCTVCDAIEETHVPSDRLEPLLSFLKNKKKFYPDEHVFQLNGICGSCRAKQ